MTSITSAVIERSPFFFLQFTYTAMFTMYIPLISKRDGKMMSNSVWSAACNYPGSHWFTSYPARPDSPQIVYGHRYPGSDWTLVVPTQLYYISHTSPFIHCVLRLLLGKICKAVEFDPFQNKLRCTVLAALSSRSIQQLGGAMCWLDLSAHLAAHTHTMDLYSRALQWKLKSAQVCAPATVRRAWADVLLSWKAT